MQFSVRSVLATVLLMLAGAFPATAAAACPEGTGRETPAEVLAIVKTDVHCTIRIAALKRAAKDKVVLAALRTAYADAAARNPGDAGYVRGRLLWLDAAAGNAAPLLAVIDRGALDPSDDVVPPSFSCWVRGLFRAGLDTAMQYCDAAIERAERTKSTRTGFYRDRGVIELLRGDYAAAAGDFDHALGELARLPQDQGTLRLTAETRYARGIARLRLGDKGGADDIARALKDYPDAHEEWDDLGITPGGSV